MTTDESAPERENPRTRRVRELILRTAIDVLLEAGAHEVTAARVAAQADVARTTVYRHWPDQRSLLLATIGLLASPQKAKPGNGPLADDVRTSLEHLRKRLVSREVRSVFGALAGYAAQDEAFGDAQRLFMQQLALPMVVVLEAAQERGELDASVDVVFEATLLAGPILHQYVGQRDDIPDRLIDEVVRRWLVAHAG